jgi:osmotically-inducible protein OsmY
MSSSFNFGKRSAALLVAVMLGSSLMAACSSTPSQQSTGEAIDDGVVTASVKAKLIEDPVTKAHQINVDTFKGNVSLSGFVESEQARARALQLARDVDGVKSVKDGMQVRKATS